MVLRVNIYAIVQITIIVLIIFKHYYPFMDYPQYCSQICWDQNFGYLTSPHHKATSFDLQALSNICRTFRDISHQEKLYIISNFPDLKVVSVQDMRDNAILHDKLTYLLNIYLVSSRKNGLKDTEIILHKHFCAPLLKVSRQMDIKPAMLINTCTNWQPINDKYIQYPQIFSTNDFQLKFYLTNNPKQEMYFMGASIMGSFHMVRVVKACFQMQKIIEDGHQKVEKLIKLFGICIQAMDKITTQVMNMYEKLDPSYFFNELRPFIQGYSDLLFVTDERNNIEGKRLKASGATAGYDPSFQMFQSAIGINFEGAYKETQDVLFQQGMWGPHKKAILAWKQCYFHGNPNIRNVCKSDPSLKTAYNQLLKKYKSFMGLHTLVIQKYILRQIPSESREEVRGTAGTLIVEILQRYQIISQQLLQ